jgi:KDO2-lipid IV(A) lauroyltransferase
MRYRQAVQGLALWSVFYLGRWVVQGLPWRWALWLGTLVGSLHALVRLDPLQRHIRAGLQAVWPEPLTATVLQHYVRRNFITRYKHLVDSFFYQRLDEVLIRQVVPTVEGLDYLEAACKDGKGAILLMSHFGSFGLLIGGLVFRGYRLAQIGTLTPQTPYRTWRCVERAVISAKRQCWEHERADFIYWKPGMYLRPLYRRLRQGDVLVLYGDGARGQQFTTVEFLGQPLHLSVGPFRIAAKAQVPLIPAFIVRQADDTHRVILEPPLTVQGDDPASLQYGVSQYATLLAEYVRRYPEHWFTWARLQRVVEDEKEAGLEIIAGDVEQHAYYTPKELTVR